MSDKNTGNALVTLKQAVMSAYPDRPDVAALVCDGNVAQAWQAYSHLLGIKPMDLAGAIAPVFGIPVAESVYAAQSNALALIPSAFCQANLILPLRIENKQLWVATADPTDSELTQRLRFITNRSVQWLLAPPEDIDFGILGAYGREAERAAMAELSANEVDVSDNAIVRFGRALIATAFRQRASDLHIQPFLGSAVVRIRVDGVLRKLTVLTDAIATALIRHYMARSGMDSTNFRTPQDGRMSTILDDDRDIDMRVSMLPASRGQRLVIRFLDQSKVHHLKGAGFSHAALQLMRRAVALPSGLVILTGPTGCGKTSTLYAMLAELNNVGFNIITVENPVEYRIAGISQVEVNEKAGPTFEDALRSILRQDPDVILIGEIRDAQTAEIAIQAALTGHLVFSTVHTNNALTVIPRLLNLGIDPSTLADSLSFVVAQRLCRILCTTCKAPVTDPLSPDEKYFLDATRNRPGGRAVGCKECDYTGYRGRLPIVDIIEMNSELRDAVATGENHLSTLAKLRSGGLNSLAVSGSMRIISGDTTVAEALQVVGPGFWQELAQYYGSTYSTEMVELLPQAGGQGKGVLLISRDPDFGETVRESLESTGMRLIVCDSPEMAQTILTKDEEVAFIVANVLSDGTVDQAVARVREIKLHTARARLPAIVLLPSEQPQVEEALIAAGVTAMFLTKPLAPDALARQIRRLQAR